MRALLLALFATPALSQDGFFQTPSGNMHCYGGPDAVDCEIVQSDVPPPLARPLDCDLEWGARFAVGPTGPGDMVCYGDTVRSPGSPVLAYGDQAKFGQVTCLSTEAGLECANPDGGGFFISRRGQRVF